MAPKAQVNVRSQSSLVGKVPPDSFINSPTSRQSSNLFKPARICGFIASPTNRQFCNRVFFVFQTCDGALENASWVCPGASRPRPPRWGGVVPPLLGREGGHLEKPVFHLVLSGTPHLCPHVSAVRRPQRDPGQHPDDGDTVQLAGHHAGHHGRRPGRHSPKPGFVPRLMTFVEAWGCWVGLTFFLYIENTSQILFVGPLFSFAGDYLPPPGRTPHHGRGRDSPPPVFDFFSLWLCVPFMR